MERKRSAGNPAWQKGVAQNPGGRKKGIKDWRFRYRKILEEHFEEIVERVIDVALPDCDKKFQIHNARMLEFIAARIMPLLPKSETFLHKKLGLSTCKTLDDKLEKIDIALENAEISVETHQTLNFTFVKRFELVEVDKRLTKLEIKDSLMNSNVSNGIVVERVDVNKYNEDEDSENCLKTEQDIIEICEETKKDETIRDSETT